MKYLFIILVVVCTLANAQIPQPKNLSNTERDTTSHPWLFFEIYNAGQLRGYIFGASHVPLGNYDLPNKITAALKRSSALVLESNYFDATIQKQANQILLSNPHGESVKEFLSPSIYSQLQKLYALKNIPQENRDTLNHWSPYMIAEVLGKQCLSISVQGFSPEVILLKQAQSAETKILGMEGAEEQLGWLIKISPNEWDKYLEAYFKWISDKDCNEQYKRNNNTTNDAIINGDLKALYAEHLRFYSNDLKLLWFQEHYLLNKRNEPLARKIIEITKREPIAFFSVGALHLPGPQGILSILKSEGYEVVQHF